MPRGEDGTGPFGGGIYHMKCDFRYLVDNLMDLTHEKYVHSSSICQHELDAAKPHLEDIRRQSAIHKMDAQSYSSTILGDPVWFR